MNNITPPAFEDAAHWCELGISCFAASAIAYIIRYGFLGSMTGIDSLFVIMSLVLAWATYDRLVKPLRLGKVPKHARKWAIFLGLMGMFFGLVIGIYVLFHADTKIKDLLKTL